MEKYDINGLDVSNLIELVQDKNKDIFFSTLKATILSLPEKDKALKYFINFKDVFDKEVIKVIQAGLLINGRESYITYSEYTKDGKIVPNFRLNIMVAGLIKAITKQYKRIVVGIVREKDHFTYEMIDLQYTMSWKPYEGDRGEITKVFAGVVLDDKSLLLETMSISEINAIRDSFGSNYYKRVFDEQTRKYKNGPINTDSIWHVHYEEMAKKTIIHRLCKRLYLNSEIEEMVKDVEKEYDFTQPKQSNTDKLADLVKKDEVKNEGAL